MKNLEKLSFNRRDRNAIVCLLTIILSGYTYNLLMKPKVTDETQLTNIDQVLSESILITEKNKKPFPKAKIIEKIKPIISKQKKSQKLAKEENKTVRLTTIKPKPFDPNSIDSLAWIELGIPHYNIKTINNFKTKGGHFYNCSDLYKIYGLDSMRVSKIISYCRISVQPKKTNYVNKSKVNINTADTSELKKLYGIGSKLSARIIKYRDRLGGFHSVNQLQEVWGIERKVIDDNSENLFCDGKIRQININSISKEKLSKHIFFNYKQAKIITNYRNQHGSFEDLNQLKSIAIINDSIYNKILPYIKLK